MPPLVACVRLPSLPLVAHHGFEPCDVPRTVHRGRGAQARIVFADDVASARGVAPGLTLAAARARCAELETATFDDALVERLQRDVIRRLLSVSPRIASAGLRRFWVEPTPDPASLADFCRGVARELAPHAPIGVGIGPSATVAYAAARAVQHGARIVPAARAITFLDECPIEVLDVPSDVLDVFASLGIRTVRQLRALDPVSLGMRFGPEVAAARRRAEGDDLRGPAVPAHEHVHAVDVELSSATETLDPVVFLLRSAVDRWLASMRVHGLGATALRLVLRLERRPGAERERELSLRSASPFVDARVLLESLRTALERVELDAPVHGFSLVATSTSPLGDTTLSLPTEAPGRDVGAREVALDRLRARLGGDAVLRATHVEASALLDRASFVRTTLDAPSPRAADEPHPLRRIDPPVPLEGGVLRLGGRRRIVTKTSLVERTSTPWWKDGETRTVLYAHAEVEGPLLVLLRGEVGTGCDDRWEAVAYLD